MLREPGTAVDLVSLLPREFRDTWVADCRAWLLGDKKCRRTPGPAAELDSFFAAGLRQRLREHCRGSLRLRNLLAAWAEKARGRRGPGGQKDAAEAARLRKRGNESFVRGNNGEALRRYTEAIARAPLGFQDADASNGGGSRTQVAREASLALGNRSAVLLALGYAAECIRDIESALRLGHGCPEKLLVRKARAGIELLKKGEACSETTERYVREAFQACAVRDGSLSTADGPRQRVVEELAERFADASRNSAPSRERAAPTLRLDGKKPRWTNPNIRIRPCGRTGSCVAAESSLNSGVTVFVEAPFASILSREWRGRRCETCMDFVGVAGMPCRSCAGHWYCSSQCEESGWEFHWRECCSGWIDDVGEAERLVVRAYSLLDSVGSQRDEEGDSAMFLRLRHHIFDHSPAELLRYCLTAIVLADALKLPPGEEVRLIAIAGRLRCNGFAVSVRESSDASRRPGSVVSYELAHLGTAVYLACSNLNHSCSPGASVAFAQPTEGNRSAASITVRTTRSHAPNEEICISYGPVAVEVGGLPGKSRFVGDASERLRILREKYFFVCTCVACASAPSDKSSDRPKAGGDGSAYSCVNYSTGISRCEAVVSEEDSRCPKCGNPVDLEKRDQADAEARFYKSRLDTAMGRLEQGTDEAAAAAETLSQLALPYAERLSAFHHPKYSLILGRSYDIVANICCRLGRYRQAARYCQMSTDIVSARFGPEDTRTLQERFKLVTVLFEDETADPTELERTIRELVPSYARIMGTDDGVVSDMTTMLAQLGTLGIR